MAANAPYYQMRSGQLVTAPNSTNATPSRFVTENDEYDLTTAAVISPHESRASMYPEHAARHTSADTPMHSMEENHNLAELLEAATTAAGQAAQAMDAHDAVEARTAAQAQGKGKRKRAVSSPVNDAVVMTRADAPIAPKRRRVDVPTDPQLHSMESEPRESLENNGVPSSSDSLLDDARAAGVHSAAALFRRPSEKTSRKYTRPPMSKLFMSLQLTPENFLQLQAKAKAYMLDTTYPERQNCVGNRGKGDTDMVKLRLFNCVRNFLNDGVGEEFFGENVEKPGERDAMEAARALGESKAPSNTERLTWPRDGNKIISLVTPLMRRMVTNERQRMYAIETRKGSAKKKDKEGSVEVVEATAQQHAFESASGNNAPEQSIEEQLLSAFDPSLCRVSQTLQPASPSAAAPVTPDAVPVADMGRFSRMVEDEPLLATDLLLPTDGPAEPNIRNINIFLVLAPHTMPSGSVKAGVKLSERRLFSQGSHHLTTYPWDNFLREVIKLLKAAKARYPAIRERLEPQEYRYSSPPATIETLNAITNNLRELAAAANAIQGDNNVSGEVPAQKQSETNPTDDPSTDNIHTVRKEATAVSTPSPAALDLTDPEATLLPRYVIKTIGPDGWEYIEKAEQWGDLLQRRGHEIWADGIINVIVELVEIPVPMERAVGGQLVSVGGKKDAASRKGKEKAREDVDEGEDGMA